MNHWSDRDAKWVDDSDWSQNIMALFEKTANFKTQLQASSMQARASKHRDSWTTLNSHSNVKEDILTLSKRKRADSLKAARGEMTPTKKMKAPMIA